MYLYANTFWGGFDDKSDACHVGFFEHILSEALEVPVVASRDINVCDILLECVNYQGTLLRVKKWKYSILFCGEGCGFPLPSHVNEYSFVMGSKPAGNFVPCPLYTVYEYCKPFEYSKRTTVPEKSICSVLSTDKNCRRRTVLQQLAKRYPIDMGGRLYNNIGYTVPGQYFEKPILDFYSKYKLVVAFENAELDYYITEKILNPIRAGVVPLYMGSPIVSEYIHESRFVHVDDTRELEKVLQSPEYFLQKANGPIFKKTLEECMREIVQKIV